jgi:glycosyltransferase involved in cell wall biosynthesis
MVLGDVNSVAKKQRLQTYIQVLKFGIKNLFCGGYKVGIIMPCYNTKGELLESAISSVLEQTYTNFLLVIVNDGSTEEDTIQVLEKFSNRSQIKVITTKNQGKNEARDVAISYMLNTYVPDYLGFIDSDDCYFPWTIEKMLKAAVLTGADCITGDATRDNLEYDKLLQDYKNNQTVSGELVPAPLHEIYGGALWRNLYKLEFFNDLDQESARLLVGGDTVLNYQLFFKMKTKWHLAIPIYYYREVATSVTSTVHSDRSNHKDAFIQLTERTISFAKNIVCNEQDIEKRLGFLYSIYKLTLWHQPYMDYDYTTDMLDLIEQNIKINEINLLEEDFVKNYIESLIHPVIGFKSDRKYEERLITMREIYKC